MSTPTGIACMADGAGPALPPTAYCSGTNIECCYLGTGQPSLSCVQSSGACSTGTDIVCDKPSQCGAGACWMCLDSNNDLLGTSCSVQTLETNGCKESQIVAVCEGAGAGCSGSQTCTTQTVSEFPAGWFWTCQ